jgi:hypothetical protein
MIVQHDDTDPAPITRLLIIYVAATVQSPQIPVECISGVGCGRSGHDSPSPWGASCENGACRGQCRSNPWHFKWRAE